MLQANSIQEVIDQLGTIIATSKEKKSRIGYFATLYRRMTIAVQEGIATGVFEDGQRMAHLDVIFANRYLQAWEAYTTGKPCRNAWCAAFGACNDQRLIVLQHLILGINTHINLDLAIAAAEACPGDSIYDLQKDFEKINHFISALTDDVQQTLSRIWLPLKLLTRLSNKRHEPVLNFSIETARRMSWANAVALATVEGKARDNYINMIDSTVVKIAQRVISPGFGASLIVRPIRVMEDRDVSRIIGILNDERVQQLAGV